MDVCYRTDHPNVSTQPGAIPSLTTLLATSLLGHARNGGTAMASSARDRPWPATLTLGPDGRITSWSRGAQALFGLSAARACGRRLRALLVRPEDRATVDELFGSVLAGRSWSGSLPLLDADGRALPVECGWQPIQDRRGRPGALIVVTDRVDTPDDVGADEHEPTAEAPLGTAHAALEAISQFQEHAATVAMMRRVQLLTDANTMIGSTLDMAATAAELMEVAVPRFADSASVAVLESVAADFELPDRPAGTGAVLRWIGVIVSLVLFFSILMLWILIVMEIWAAHYREWTAEKQSV